MDEERAADADAAAGDGGSVTVVTPVERSELLESNRRNREKARDEVAAKQRKEDEKAAKRAAKASGPRERATVTLRQSAVIAAIAVLAVLLAGVGTLTYLYVHERGKADSPDLVAGALSADTPAITAASEYAESVLTYNWGDYADLDRRLREFSTPEFADLFIAQSQEPRKANDEAQVSATAEVVGAGLMSQADGEAEVLLAIDRTITSPQLESIPDGDRQQGRIRVTLVKSGDRWLLSGIRNV